MAGPTASNRAEYEKWFRAADKNNNGFLTNKELKKMFKQRGYKTSGKQFKRQFSSMDRDGDKKVSMTEYLFAMGQLPEFQHREADLRKRFEAADRNGDGKLDLDEMKALMKEFDTGLTSKQVFDIMHKADRNKSGAIDYNEFLQLFMERMGYFD